MDVIQTAFNSLLQLFDNVDNALVASAVNGIGLGAIIGLIVWPMVKEPEVTGRIFFGAFGGLIIGAIVEVTRLGRSLGTAFNDTIRNALTPDAAGLSNEFTMLIDHIMLAIVIGAGLMALISATNRALLGGLIGLGIGALSGLFVGAVLLNIGYPPGGFIYRIFVTLTAVIVLWLGFGRSD